MGQAMGRRDVQAMRRVLGSALGLSAVTSTAPVGVGWLAAPAILRALATPPEVFPLALAYLRVIFVAMPPGFISVLLTMALRGVGDAITPLKFMALGSVLDVALNPVFILGLGPVPALGIEGSAIATLIANTGSLLALVTYLYAKDLVIRLRGAEWRYLLPTAELLKTIVVKGFPMGLQMLVVSTSALAMMGLVNRHGTSTTAAYGAANQLWTYIQMPAMAVGAAVSAMAAQNIGAGQWDRVDRITRAGLRMNLLLTGVLVLAVTLLDRHVLWLFLGNEEGAIDIAAKINLIGGGGFCVLWRWSGLAGTGGAQGAWGVARRIPVVWMFTVRLRVSAPLQVRLPADAVYADH